MHKPRRLLAATSITAVALGLTGCSLVEKVEPKAELKKAGENLADADAVSLTLRLTGDAEAFQSLDPSSEMSAEDEETLEKVLTSSITVGYDKGEEGPEDDKSSLSVNVEGVEAAELRTIGETLYLKVDVQELGNKYPELQDGVQELRDGIEGEPSLKSLTPALDGAWVSLDASEEGPLGKYLEESGQEEVPGSTELNTEPLTTALKDVIENDSEVTRTEKDGVSHLVVTTSTRAAYDRLAPTLPLLLEGTGLEEHLTEDTIPPSNEVEDREIRLDLWVEDDELTRIEVPLGQFADDPSAVKGDAAIRVDVETDAPIEAPDAEAIDVEALLETFGPLLDQGGLGAGLGEDGFGESGLEQGGAEDGFEPAAPTDGESTSAAEAADLVGETIVTYASFEERAATSDLIPDVEADFGGYQLKAVGKQHVQVTSDSDGSVACVVLDTQVDMAWSVEDGECPDDV